MELVKVASLHEEVRFLAKRLPQLLDHALEIDELVGFHKMGRLGHDGAHDVNVLRHDLLGAGALHLDGHILAREQRSSMHLRERRASQGLAVDMREYLSEWPAVFGDEAIVHHGERNGLHVRAKTTQLIAVLLRQDLGAIGEDLPHLDEHGTQILEHAPQSARRKIVPCLVLAHDRQDLSDALATAARGELDLLGRSHGLRLLREDVDGARHTP